MHSARALTPPCAPSHALALCALSPPATSRPLPALSSSRHLPTLSHSHLLPPFTRAHPVRCLCLRRTLRTLRTLTPTALSRALPLCALSQPGSSRRLPALSSSRHLPALSDSRLLPPFTCLWPLPPFTCLRPLPPFTRPLPPSTRLPHLDTLTAGTSPQPHRLMHRSWWKYPWWKLARPPARAGLSPHLSPKRSHASRLRAIAAPNPSYGASPVRTRRRPARLLPDEQSARR